MATQGLPDAKKVSVPIFRVIPDPLPTAHRPTLPEPYKCNFKHGGNTRYCFFPRPAAGRGVVPSSRRCCCTRDAELWVGYRARKSLNSVVASVLRPAFIRSTPFIYSASGVLGFSG